MFEWYNITSEEDLWHASLRLAEYVSTQPVTATVVLLKASDGKAVTK